MRIVELTKEQFDQFAKEHPLSSHYQSYYYGILLSEYYFDYHLIGYVDNNDNIKAASLILTKSITSFHKYGYAPKGFLIDYSDEQLLKAFTNDIKKYFKKRKCALIKINPDIKIGEIHEDNNYQTTYNQNIHLVEVMKKYGYLKLKNNLYFEAQFPRFNAIVNLNEFDGLNSVKKNARNKVRKAGRRGLSMVSGTTDDFDQFYNLIKNKKKRSKNYYQDYYNSFNKEGFIDFHLIRVDYEKFLTSAQQRFADEQAKNEELIRLMQENPTEKTIARKMQSDRDLTSYKNDILVASKNIGTERSVIIAGALVIKYGKNVSILISGYDEIFNFLGANYYLHFGLMEYYKNLGYVYFDMNGITGDFTKENPYYGLNQFKLSFNPNVYEYIGEFDLIIKKRTYKSLNNNATLAHEFNKPWSKKGDKSESNTPSEETIAKEKPANAPVEKFDDII